MTATFSSCSRRASGWSARAPLGLSFSLIPAGIIGEAGASGNREPSSRRCSHRQARTRLTGLNAHLLLQPLAVTDTGGHDGCGPTGWCSSLFYLDAPVGRAGR